MNRFERSVRAALRSAWLAAMFVEAGVELLVTRPATRQARADWLHRFCARSLRRLGITVAVYGNFPLRGSLIVNHQSYLDIIVLAAIQSCVFVSKIEVAKIPIVGWMTTMSGTVYVERGRGASALAASAGMKAAFDAGLAVVFFPEGTTNTTTELLPFRSGLLSQAMADGEPITPGFLHYSLQEANGPDISVERNICWGDLPMFTHAFTLLGLRGVQAEARFAPAPIAFSSSELHRKTAAIEARSAMDALRPTASFNL